MKVYTYNGSLIKNRTIMGSTKISTGDNREIKGAQQPKRIREGNILVTLSEKGRNLQKLMERVDKGERVNLFQEQNLTKEDITVIYNDQIDEFNQQAAKMEGNLSAPLSKEEREALLQSVLKPATKLHRLIPNIHTNAKLEKSLQNMGEEVKDAAYNIISSDFLAQDTSGKTETERFGQISLGMEKAQYLAQNYMNEEEGVLFLDAMETIAKYGINGTMSSDGKMDYQILWGPMVGAPDDVVSNKEVMKSFDPDSYAYYQGLLEKAAVTEDANKDLDAMRYEMSWFQNASREHPEWFQAKAQEYTEWKQQINNTSVPEIFKDADKTNSDGFMNSLLEQNQQQGLFQESVLRDNIEGFLQSLNKQEF